VGGPRPVLSRASNGATFTDVEGQHLYRIKYQQQPDPDTIDEEVTALRLTTGT
jgi:hypothetical protein